MTTTTYFVTRDTARKTVSDEDRAMAHASIGKFDTFDAAVQALIDYMTGEVEWLAGKQYRSSTSLRRAADIHDSIATVVIRTELSPARSPVGQEVRVLPPRPVRLV